MRPLHRHLLAPAIALLVLTGCGDAAAPREGTSIEELTGDVSGTIDLTTTEVGERVSLRATITRVLSPGAFEIRAADTATPQPVVVLNREDVLEVGQVVQVLGVVRLFDADTMSDYGVPAAQRSALEGQRVIVADEVDTDVPEDGS